MQILDYSNSQIISINTGYAKLQTGYLKLIHVIETEDYQNVINTLQQHLRQNINQSHPLYPYLQHELTQLQRHLDRIKPRVKRSLNFIGSTWKWIAGNPDHDDFEIIEQKINNVLSSNNRQVVINNLSLKKIDELTENTNKIIKIVKTNENFITMLKMKIDLLKEEIVNVNYAIHWAKSGIINSFVLSNTEVNIAKELFEKDSIPFVNIEEIFEFSEVKIASNEKSLIYIVNVPTTNLDSCSKLLIKPTKSGDLINKIDYNEILVCKNESYGILKPCKSFNNLTVCNLNNVKRIEKENCLLNLLKSVEANCTLLRHSTTPTVEEVLPGMILLNQFDGTILINDEQYNLTGTFIIKFQNASITIDNETYNYFQTTYAEPLPAILQPRSPGSKIEEVTTLEFVKRIHLNNTKAIELLNIKNKWSAAVHLLTIAAALILVLFLIRRKQRPLIETVNLAPPNQLSVPTSNSTNFPRDVPRLSQIPYF